MKYSMPCRAFVHSVALVIWSCTNAPPGTYRRKICQRAAEYGQLAVLQWARANDYPWDDYTCTNAAINGHLEVLKWARANGCPWNEWMREYAAHNSHLDVLGWARANACRE